MLQVGGVKHHDTAAHDQGGIMARAAYEAQGVRGSTDSPGALANVKD